MIELSVITDFLHGIPPFNTLQDDELEWLARKLEAAYYPQEKFILSSEPAPGLCIIRKGAVRLLSEERKFLDKRSEGGLFGHAIYFHGELRPYKAEAEEDCLAWHLSQDDFETVCARYPLIGEYFSSHLKTRLGAAAQVRHSVALIRDLLRHEPVMIDAGATIRDASRTMSEQNVSSVLVMRGEKLAGIVTDKDLRQRVLAQGRDPQTDIAGVMTPDPRCLEADSGVDAALLLMMRENYHHLPVLEEGRPVGLVTAGDILRAQSEHPLRLVRDIYKRDSLEALERLSLRLPSLFERMVALGRDVEQIGRMVTYITDAFTVRLLQIAERELGEPPMEYAWLAFGSQGREEQTAKTDQDNGLVLERKADKTEAAYFDALSRSVCDGLDRLGYVYCPGEIMAMNTKWRVSLAKWKRHFDGWIDEPEPKSVMHSSIFFDMRCVHGNAALVEDLKAYAYGRARENRIFRRFMAANVLKHRPPLGFFRRFVQEDDGSHSEGLNLKHRGIVPITDLARIRALEGEISEPGTLRRLELAAAQGVMNSADAESLRDAYILINRIRLNHQSAQMAAGQKPGNFVPPDDLSPLMRRNLKTAFMMVTESQEALATRYQVG